MNQHLQHSNKEYKHLLLMAICCLVVILAIIILPKYFNIGALGYIFLILLCPVLHYFLMRKIHKDGKHHDAQKVEKITKFQNVK